MGKNTVRDSDEGRDDKVVMTGVILENNTGLFRVKIDSTEQIVVCQPSGKIRKNKIVLVAGDKVKVEMSPYDLTKGRISFRL